MSDILRCSRCSAEGMIFGPADRREKFLERQGWRMMKGAWVCNFCTGIGIPGYDGRPLETSEDDP